MPTYRLLAAFAALAPCAAAQLHVPGAYPDIKTAIHFANDGETVIVADGVWTGPGNKNLDYRGKNIVVRSANGPERCIIDCAASPTDPHRGFLFESGETRAAVVDGFTIVRGNTLPGAIADQFNGGAVRIRNGASPTIMNCVFRDNVAACWGGGVYVATGSAPLIMNCLFENNSADDGGGMFTWLEAAPEVRSSVFVRNSASNAGGAIAEFGGGMFRLDGCTIVQNTAASWSVGGIVDFGNQSTVVNSIVWGNSGTSQILSGAQLRVRFSNVQGGYAGEGNLAVDPRFLPDGYHLSASSPCIGAAIPAYAVALGQTDIDGEPRIQGGRLDMGADEREGLILPRLGDFLGSIGFGAGR